jgi:signal-transduction protein with cAMP-binding, CBS, and nucleotidyltransferase domain
MIIDFFKQWNSYLHTKKDRFAYLRNFPILKDFNTFELYLFSQIINERNYKENEFVYLHESPLEVLYLILSGSIEITDYFKDTGKAILLDEYQFLGIIELFNDNKRKGDAKAKSDSVLLAISHLDFKTFIKNNPRTGTKLLNNICLALSNIAISQYQ